MYKRLERSSKKEVPALYTATVIKILTGQEKVKNPLVEAQPTINSKKLFSNPTNQRCILNLEKLKEKKLSNSAKKMFNDWQSKVYLTPKSESTYSVIR